MTGPIVHILGPGRIGSLVATSLASTVPPAQVSLIFRSREKLLKYQQNGSTISMWSDGLEPTMALERKIPGICIGPKEPSSDYIENLIVTTKAQRTLSAIKPVLRNLDRNSNVLLLQNGVGVLENLVEKYWSRDSTRPNLMLGATSHAVRTFSGPWRFNHVGSGYLKLAQVPRDTDQKLKLANTIHFEKTDSEACVRADQVAENLDLSATAVLPDYRMSPLPTDSEASVKSDYSCDIKIFTGPLPALFKALLRSGPILNAEVLPYPEFLLAQYEKLIVNACINPVAALLQCTNGALLHTDHVESIFKAIIRESLQMIVPYIEDHVYTADCAPIIRTTLESNRLLRIVNQVCEQTADNRNSMLNDVESGHTTEIKYINEYITGLAFKQGRAASTNFLLSNLVKARTSLTRMSNEDYLPFEL